MLITLVLWIYSTLVTFLAGDALLRIGRRVAGSLPAFSMPFVCLLGATALTGVLGWAWLLVPINLITHAVLVGLLVCYAIWQRPRPLLNMPGWPSPWSAWTTAGILTAVILFRSVQLPRLADTGGYHAPMIEWMYQYAITPGLANLNYRFGFNNSWFLLSAFFRFQLATGVPWHGLNGWLLVMLGWFSLTEWHRYYQPHKRSFSAWLGGWLAPAFLVIFHWTLSSPSPDLPTHIYVVLCFWIWLRWSESGNHSDITGWLWVLLILSLSALTTKLSALTILLLPAIGLLKTGNQINGRRWLLFSATAGIMTGYWFIGNVVLSGYLVYPSLSPVVDWFAVDWKVPYEMIALGLRNLQQGTRGDVGPTFSLAWIPYWFKTRPVLEQGIFVSLIGAPALIVWRLTHQTLSIPGYRIAILTAWLGVVFWFLLAPEIRFGAGNVLIALGLCYGPVLSELRAGNRVQLIAACIVGLIGVGLLLAAIRREPVDVIKPAGYPGGLVRVYKAGNHFVFYPTDDTRVINGIRGYWGECYDATLPCSPYPIPGLQWRGSSLENGFRAAKSISY